MGFRDWLARRRKERAFVPNGEAIKALLGLACSARFAQLIELGIDRFSVSGPNFLARGGVDREAAERLTADVLPGLRG